MERILGLLILLLYTALFGFQIALFDIYQYDRILMIFQVEEDNFLFELKKIYTFMSNIF